VIDGSDYQVVCELCVAIIGFVISEHMPQCLEIREISRHCLPLTPEKDIPRLSGHVFIPCDERCSDYVDISNQCSLVMLVFFWSEYQWFSGVDIPFSSNFNYAYV
jgi:hypothetical protein